MSWQRCPICNGIGQVENYGSSSLFSVCTTCEGKKIISEITGLPPVYESTQPSTQKTDKDGFNISIEES